MMQFFMGCALWGYKGWAGTLFPAKARSADYLKLYGARFTAVEGNTTFYSMPDAKTVTRWATETPEGFRFCPKLPKWVTHQGALVPQIEQALQFVGRMQGLGDRLGPLLVQLPPNYGPTEFEDLAQFLTALPRSQVQIAVEVRHPEWFHPQHEATLTEQLTTLGIGRVVLDTRPVYEVPDDPQLASERHKPRVPVVFTKTAPFSVIRYISHPQWDWNLPFLADWFQPLAAWLQSGSQIYFFVHCPIEARSPENARCIQAVLETQGLAIPPLPWNELEPPPMQLTLL